MKRKKRHIIFKTFQVTEGIDRPGFGGLYKVDPT